MAIPGATTSIVDQFLESRAAMRDLATAGGGFVPAAAAAYLMSSPLRDFTIAATAVTDGGARYRAELQIRLTEQPGQPYQVVAWRTPPADTAAPAPPPPRRSP